MIVGVGGGAAVVPVRVRHPASRFGVASRATAPSAWRRFSFGWSSAFPGRFAPAFRSALTFTKTYSAQPTRTGSGTRVTPKAARTPSRTVRATARMSAVVAAPRLVRASACLVDSRHRAVPGEALAESGPLHQPAGRELHPAGGRVVRDGPVHRGLQSGEVVLVHHGVGEERTDAPGVAIGFVEHHPLGRPQRQHRGAHPVGCGAFADRNPKDGSEFGVADGSRASVGGEAEFHLEHRRRRGVLQDAVPVAETQIGGGDPLHVTGGSGSTAEPGQPVGHFDAVSADVLDGRRAG